MKRLFPFLTVLMVCVTADVGRADTLSLWVNNGSGDNFGYIGQMNGHQFMLSGGTNPWFFGVGGYDPGSGFGGETPLYLYGTTVWVNGAPVDLLFPSMSSTLFMTSFTLPTNGQDFRMLVQIGFSASGVNFDLPQPIDIGGSAGGWIEFYYSDGKYYPSGFVQATVPEPGTLALVSAGLGGIIAAARWRRSRTPWSA
jgi:PEP-CTERM motif-containing protein